MFDLSIVIPCYNEEKNLSDLVNQIKIIKRENHNINFEFILVNDGSTDKTSSILLDLNINEIFKGHNKSLNLTKIIYLREYFSFYVTSNSKSLNLNI